MKRKTDIQTLVNKLLAGERRAAARLISEVENSPDSRPEIMRRIYPHTGKAMILGITGTGGAGKSTLVDHLIRGFRQRGRTVGVVVVDPSSPFSGGAFLGDRIRLQAHAQDPGVYIRSMASRGYLGGVARASNEVIRIMEAMGCDTILVETLGAGQDEIDVIQLSQTCLLVLTPNMGDDIQAMKAGIMEIADIVVLNKADLDGTDTCLRHLHVALTLADQKDGQWVPPVIPTVSFASRPEDIRGIDELLAAIDDHQGYLHRSRAIDRVRHERIEQELALIFQEALQRIVFRGLRGTGKKRAYIEQIAAGQNDPYSVVHEVMATFLTSTEEENP